MLLKRKKNQDLVEFIQENDVTLFEGKTIISGRRGVYIQEKEKHKEEYREKNITPAIRASTPRTLEIGIQLPGLTSGEEEVDLKTSLASFVGIGEDMRNSVGKVALEKKILFHTDFLEREIIYLSVCLNDDQSLRMMGATNATQHH